jgi:hypothetical protein
MRWGVVGLGLDWSDTLNWFHLRAERGKGNEEEKEGDG